MSFVFVDEVAYPVDTLAELAAAKEALAEANLTRAQVWAGAPDCPDSYLVNEWVYADGAAHVAYGAR